MTVADVSFGRMRDHDWHDVGYVEAWIDQRIDGDPDHLARVERLAGFLAAALTADRPRVLDVGTGPGVLAAAVLRAVPTSNVVCHDFSHPMLDRAQTELAWAGDRVEFAASDLAAGDWAAGLDGPFDAVVSSYAIHNLRAAEAIRSVYTDIAALLVPGGCFLLLDMVETPGPQADRLYGVRRRFDDRVPSTLAAQLGWLREAGLTDVDCIWKAGFEVALCGFRP
jgi:tRNA (cmo5U34)-methyltransferase